jgi:uncharacterized protein YbbC (DUF1343 family)/CubicO group peptidase (beta-lactamase class C family)
VARLPPSLEQALRRAAQGAIDRRELPGAVVLVVHEGVVVFHEAFGVRSVAPTREAMSIDTVFDLASLTKPLAVASTMALLEARGEVDLSAPVAHYLPSFQSFNTGKVTIEQLLLHTSGLPADNNLGDYAGSREQSLQRIYTLASTAAPGSVYRYSDLGYIVAGEVIARITSRALDAAAEALLFAPLGMHETRFRPGETLRPRIAPTGRWQDSVLRGVVHDPRARALDGVAGHAGLFAPAADLAKFVSFVLEGAPHDAASQQDAAGPHDAIWARARASLLKPRTAASRTRTLLGGYVGAGIGHTGFTGTSYWFDVAHRTGLIILSHRVYDAPTPRVAAAPTVSAGSAGSAGAAAASPARTADPLRAELTQLLLAHPLPHMETQPARVSGAAPSQPAATPRLGPPVAPGIDTLRDHGFAELRGHTVALLTHDAARARDGASTSTLLQRAPGVTLVALWSPEHGLSSTLDTKVQDARDAQTGLPVHSLYSAQLRPTRAMLHGATTVVVDLQDVGARFYTYLTTLGYVLEAAPTLTDKGVKVVVLDRPNPNGLLAVEGPLLDRGRESFIGYHTIPIRHGMTLGELARLFVAERHLTTDLNVVPVTGLTREMLWSDTGLTWVAPSPALTTETSALLYPGLALLESTNVSVGRGTSAPFKQFGAPWVESEALLRRWALAPDAGVRATPVTFTPSTSKYAGLACHGLVFEVVDARALESVRLGLHLAELLRDLYPREFQATGVASLLGNRAAFDRLQHGATAADLTKSFAQDARAFDERRRPFLIYGAPPRPALPQ